MDKSFEKISLAARNYADALIDLGKSGEISLESIASDLEAVNEAFTESKDLSEVMENPSFDEDTKIDIINSIFSGKINQYIINFLNILIQKRRINEFFQIYAEFRDKLNKIKNIQPVKIISAVALNEDQKNRILAKLSSKLNKNILPDWETDEDIIAGITVKINDDVIDMSLKNRIDKLSKSLMLK